MNPEVMKALQDLLGGRVTVVDASDKFALVFVDRWSETIGVFEKMEDAGWNFVGTTDGARYLFRKSQ